MPYGAVNAYRTRNRLTIIVDLPDRGELSSSGRSDNLVDPRNWIDLEDPNEVLKVKVTVCRPFRRNQSMGPGARRAIAR